MKNHKSKKDEDWVHVVTEKFEIMKSRRAETMGQPKSSIQRQIFEESEVENGKVGSGPPSCGSDWMFVSFYGVATFVNTHRLEGVIKNLAEVFPCGSKIMEVNDGHEYIDFQTQPPLGVTYVHTERHVEASVGVLLNAEAIRFLKQCPKEILEGLPVEVDPEVHTDIEEDNPIHEKILTEHGYSLRASQRADNLLSVDVYQILKRCGVLVIHSRRFVPQVKNINKNAGKPCCGFTF